MRKKQSALFAPYKTLGLVCGATTPAFHITESVKGKKIVCCCAVDNVVYQYDAVKLRLLGVSECLPVNVGCVVVDKGLIYAAAGTVIYKFSFGDVIISKYTMEYPIKHLMVLNEDLIVVDNENNLRVIQPVGNSLKQCDMVLKVHIQGASNFDVTAVFHPATYLNKILLGSKSGSLRLLNIRTGKVIHEFMNFADAPITCIEQTPAVDVVAVGLENGRVIVHNIKADVQICSFKHDKPITAVGFRNDGEPIMVSADTSGHLAVWNLETQELVGKITKFHSGPVTKIYFLTSEPVMVTTSADNSIRNWILDGADGMPRLYNSLEGHAQPATAVRFSSKHEVVSSSLDGCVRKHNVQLRSMRQKLGSAGIMSKAKAKKKGISLETIQLDPVVEVAIGWSREAAWDNMLCRHKDELQVTTWTTRNERQGTHTLLHDRFKKDSALATASATSICVSSCGNFAFIGYSSGHIDQYNIQSGKLVKSFEETKQKGKKKGANVHSDKYTRAHSAPVTALLIDARGHELISASSSGDLKFWQIRSGKRIAVMKTRFEIFAAVQCPVSSLIAVSYRDAEEEDSVAIIDSLCRRVVRKFPAVSSKVNCLTFSSDGRWLLVADESNHVRVWEISTSQLVDVLLFENPCVGMSFNATGEFLATVHEGDNAVHVWANKQLFTNDVVIKALPVTYLPQWEETISITIDYDDSSDEDDSDNEDAEDVKDIKPFDVVSEVKYGCITYSGLAPSRWANLVDIDLIKERNKPTDPVKKPKQAPFFLSAAPTLEGFEFEAMDEGNDEEQRKTLQAKRSLLEIESSFTASLRRAGTLEEQLAVFEQLKKMSVSAIDFQLKNLPQDVLTNYFRMLLQVLKTRKDFDLVQSYMAAAMRIHRSSLWQQSDDGDLAKVLEQLSLEQESQWNELDDLITDNAAVIQWVKNALL